MSPLFYNWISQPSLTLRIVSFMYVKSNHCIALGERYKIIRYLEVFKILQLHDFFNRGQNELSIQKYRVSLWSAAKNKEEF